MIKIGNYNFEGPFSNASSLKDQSAVYVILGRNSASDIWNVVDVGESATVQSRIQYHDRKDCWQKRDYQSLNVAVLYVRSDHQRLEIEKELRTQYNPPCGER